MKLARGIAYLLGALLVITGVYLLGWTEDYMEMIGALAPAGLALSDMRAVFGGLELTLGIFALRLARNDATLSTACQLLFMIFVGLVIGRTYEIAMNGFPEESMFRSVLIFEVAAMAASFVAIRKS